MKQDAGFYKRRRGILEHLEVGKISLLDSGIHDYLSLKMNSVISSGTNIPPGVVFTSSRAICALCPRGITEREVRRSLEHLERLRWIKRWAGKGRCGNYPVLIARATVHSLSGDEYRVNADATTDWRKPVLIPAASCPHLVRQPATDREVEKREESALSRFSSEETVWGFLGVGPCGPPSFRSLLERGWASRNGEPRSVLIGNTVDAWEAVEGKLRAPGLFRALDKLRDFEDHRQMPPAHSSRMLTAKDMRPKER